MQGDPNERHIDDGRAAADDAIDRVVELVVFLARQLVDEPDQVSVRRAPAETAVVLELSVAPGDVGKVIGKQGRIAKAIRAVVKASAIKRGLNIVLEIV